MQQQGDKARKTQAGTGRAGKRRPDAAGHGRRKGGGRGKARPRGALHAAAKAKTGAGHQGAMPPKSPIEQGFLPTTATEMREYGWSEVDFAYVCGDAYIDHPSFGMAIITRVLAAHGYKVGIISQPDWHDDASVRVFGEPRLGFLVSSGNMDSMVNHYTVAKKHRKTDAFSPGGRMGLRPDHACVVYGNLIRRSYKKVPVILGGIEASLRRLAHYDYWSDGLKRSILLDSGADLAIYGMGERAIVELADALASGLSIQDISFIEGTAYRCKTIDHCYEPIELPSFERMQKDKAEYARSFHVQLENLDHFNAHTLAEPYERDGLFIVQNPPAAPLTVEEMDAVYALPYTRRVHPSYDDAGSVPAIREVKFSLTANRGCMGDCAFCALNFHQGRIIQTRSDGSVLAEAEAMTEDPEFKGYIHDVGGPTANFRVPACAKQLKAGACKDRRCLSPKPCKALKPTHASYLKLLRKLRELPGVKKVFIRSGVRFDYALLDPDHSFIRELAAHHVSGQLRLAPEHVSDRVLKIMGKPSFQMYRDFVEEFDKASKASGKEQYALPYLMSSHPGSTLQDAVQLAEAVRDMGYNPEQVSDFYPTPSTAATCMYFTGIDPRNMQNVYCAHDPHEKAMQRALIQYRNPKNRELVLEALRRAGRQDLIGYGKECLVRPGKGGGQGKSGAKKGAGGKGGAEHRRPQGKGTKAAKTSRPARQQHGGGKAAGTAKQAGGKGARRQGKRRD